MPELPEVETIARALAARLAGRRILAAEFRVSRVLLGSPDEMAAGVAGRTVGAIRRHGKFLIIELSGGRLLTVHLGMTGKLLLGGEPGKYTRALFTLDRGVLLYDDVRQFGRIEVSHELPARLVRLGPEPLEIRPEEFQAGLAGRRTRIKPLLLNQRFLRGVGNIYADEALFRAGIHPLAGAGRLSRERAERLRQAIVNVLREAIRAGGSSVSDYVDADGRQGLFQFSHRVYGRAGEPCRRCRAAIRRIVIAQRSAHFCPRCQKR
ncbi:MAG: bifunctional DNA-formamidopyrimidine glycosylase/DNA-(apurinic or apyrimidinic site) lyase [Acidobacteria bacterium]|nr:bifunctional DNA-formamidopyrimidine glycosylase/DNA-(apurinic or apyrimidinic site) lyase [Acidobacteriota bacterium]